MTATGDKQVAVAGGLLLMLVSVTVVLRLLGVGQSESAVAPERASPSPSVAAAVVDEGPCASPGPILTKEDQQLSDYCADLAAQQPDPPEVQDPVDPR